MAKTKKKSRQMRALSPKPSVRVGVEATDEKLHESLKATRWGESELTKFLVCAEQNTRITYLQQKGYFELFDNLGELFWKVSEEIAYRDLAGFVECLLFYRAIGSLFAAIRLGTAGQLPECYVQLRVCIESGLYAFAVQEEPASADIWINRHNDEKSRELCVKSFSVKGLLKKLASHAKPLHAQVKDLYEECIDLGAHPNERSLTANVRIFRNNRKMVLELLNTQPAVFQVCLTVCCLVGLSVAKVFALAYPTEFAEVNADLRLTNVMSQLRRIAPATLLNLSDTEQT